MQKKYMVILVLLLVGIVLGLIFNNQQNMKYLLNLDSNWPRTLVLEEVYKPIFDDVNRIEVYSGSGGGGLVITEDDEISEIMNDLKAVSLTLDTSQEERTGWRYSIKCYSKRAEEQWFELVIGGSKVSDNFRMDHVMSSPYYNIGNFGNLVSYLDGLFEVNVE